MLLGLAPALAWGDGDHLRVNFERDGQSRAAVGRVLVRDAQGGLCLQDDQGELYLIQGDELKDSEDVPSAFVPATAAQVSKRLLDELGEGFQVHTTPHYVVAYNTTREYARWLSSMLERLNNAFTNYWTRQGLKLSEPEFPLVVIVYRDQQQYLKASEKELRGASAIVGYYSLKTNRVNVYDLTGAERSRATPGGRSSLREINQMLSSPRSLPLVATIVHEATHQVAFNTGMMARFADLPLWLVEGMAVYFEAPDLSSGRGWRGIGKVNYPRLQGFQARMANWGPAALAELIKSDARLRDPQTAASAYAEAWAMNYYLIKSRPKEYRAYLQALAKKQPFEASTAQQREAEFT
ncbi:MAG: DUF1570 domain-containing protein, partial [Myxococcales bacterium]|nr:DUF1570 domain-containing protein [Myxococcales bacterium]